MKVSLYTAMRNCIDNDYPFVEMLRHHLPLADEIVVNEGHSTDGTYDAIRAIDSKIRVIRTHWNAEQGQDWWIHFKDSARRACTGDWCVHLDSDEFIPEWEFDRLRAFMETTTEVMAAVSFTNFYGNHGVYHRDPAKSKWVTRKMIIHRNRDDIEFWGDGSNIRLKNVPFTWGDAAPAFSVHHFGGVRHPGRLRRSWWLQGRFRVGRSVMLRPPAWLFDLFPAKWEDPDFLPYLEEYNGRPIKAVRDNPDRFVRDGYRLLRAIEARDALKALGA